MKKLISFLVIAILVSSCGNRLSLVKRHYTKGFYVESGKKSEHIAFTKAEKENKQIKKSQPAAVSFLTEEKLQDVEFLVSAKTNSIVQAEKKSSFQSQLKKHNLQVSQIVTRKVSENPPFFLKKEKSENSKSSGSDVDLIILIILCFFPFINLIAMYLHDGKNITMNFWIDLILDCLFFFPGIVFALLVVLDVINLA